jgi:hypothetical protein
MQTGEDGSRPGYREADRRVDHLVRQIADVVNGRTGANSPIRQVGVDPGTRHGVRIAAPDAIVIGADDADRLGKLHRRGAAGRGFGDSTRALRGVVEAVTDLVVRLDPPQGRHRLPSERGRWDRPEDREYLQARAEHHNLQAAVTGALTQASYLDVLTELARRDLVRREFASEVRWAGRPEPSSALAVAGAQFVQRLSEKIPGSDRTILLARLNSRPPELKAREAADQLLRSRVEGWDYTEPLPHRSALGRLAGRIEQDFGTLDSAMPAAALEDAGRRIAERAADEAGRIAAGFESEGRGRPRPEQAAQAVPMTMLDGVATAGSDRPGDRAQQDPAAATDRGVQGKALTQEP